MTAQRPGQKGWSGPGTAWQRYAALMRELDQVRLDEEQRTASVREGAQTLSAQVHELTAVAREQQGQLGDLATVLRVRMPRLSPVPPRQPASTAGDGPRDPSEPARLAARDLAEVAALAHRAQQRGRRAALLPGWPVGPRNVVVYTGLVVAFQGLMFAFGPRENGFAVLFGTPSAAFLTGFVVISMLGRVRIKPEPVRRHGQPQPPDPDRASVRAGLLICFSAAPVLALTVVGLAALRR